MIDKIPPHDIDTERMVLSSCLFDPEAMREVADILIPEDFYNTPHKVIYSACLDLYNAKKPVELPSIASRLGQKGELEGIGGAVYLSRLSTESLAVNIQHYAQSVKDKSVLRATINKAHSIIEDCHSGKEVNEILDNAQSDIMQIDYGSSEKAVPVAKIIDDCNDHLTHLSKNPGVTGIPTGLDIDDILCGFHKKDLIIVAARPAMGKTAFMLQLAERASKRGHAPTVFSIEMTKEQLGNRLISGEAMVNGMRFQDGYVTKEDWAKINTASGRLYDLNIWVDDTGDISHMEIRRRMRKLKRNNGTDICFIDYLQLIDGDKNKSRTQEVGSITRQLKRMAKELDMPVVLLCQLNRDLEKRTDKRPVLSDLRDSGEIEQDADVVMFIYRDEVYKKKSEYAGTAEILIRKNRQGRTGMIPMAWLGEYTRFGNLAKDHKLWR